LTKRRKKKKSGPSLGGGGKGKVPCPHAQGIEKAVDAPKCDQKKEPRRVRTPQETKRD